jgi:hypothetical protein
MGKSRLRGVDSDRRGGGPTIVAQNGALPFYRRVGSWPSVAMGR